MSILSDSATVAEDVVRYSRLCYERHLVGAAGGNLSARVPGSNAFLVTATGVSLRDVTRDNLLAVDSEGKVLEGPAGAKPSKETSFHLAVYKVRPEVGAVIHVHPTHGTVFALRKELIPTVTISARLKLKQGTVVPQAPPGSQELSDLVARSVEESPPEASIFLMEAHGMLATGRSLGEAFDSAELAEDTATIAYLGELLRPRREVFPDTLRIVDLTAPLNERIPSYPTDPRFAKSWHVLFNKHGVCVSKLEMGAHSGTHVDAPLHFLGNSFPDVSQVPLDRFIGEAVALDRPKTTGENLTVDDLNGADIRSGDIVLFRTGWDKRAGSPAFFEGEWPGLKPSLVEELVRRGVKAIGGDIASADSPAAIAAGAPAHKAAGRAKIPVFEALINLEQVTGQRFYFLGFPLNLVGCEASPIRAVALLPNRRVLESTPEKG